VFVNDAVFGVKLFSRVGMSYYFVVAQAISTLEKVKTYAEKGSSGILSHGPFANNVKLAEFVDLSTRRLRVIRELVFEHLLRVPLSLEELAGNILVKLGVVANVENILLGSAMINSIILHLMESACFTIRFRAACEALLNEEVV
jgi:hypothetical protein